MIRSRICIFSFTWKGIVEIVHFLDEILVALPRWYTRTGGAHNCSHYQQLGFWRDTNLVKCDLNDYRVQVWKGVHVENWLNVSNIVHWPPIACSWCSSRHRLLRQKVPRLWWNYFSLAWAMVRRKRFFWILVMWKDYDNAPLPRPRIISAFSECKQLFRCVKHKKFKVKTKQTRALCMGTVPGETNRNLAFKRG